jgi:predicted transcriptional regulator
MHFDVVAQNKVKKTLDQTKKRVSKNLKEVKLQNQEQVIKEFQESTIETARDIIDNLLESQKEIINTCQSVKVPLKNRRSSRYYWMSPVWITALYTKAISNFADNTIVAAKLANNTTFRNMDAFRSVAQQARDNAHELSKIGADMTKRFSKF